MRRSRRVVTLASSALWPLAVLGLPAGVLLASPPVYAEAGAAIPTCPEGALTACTGKTDDSDGKTALDQPGKCRTQSCGAGGQVISATQCFALELCADVPAGDCANKSEGAACDASGDPRVQSIAGTCKTRGGCYVPQGATHVPSSVLTCQASPSASDRDEDEGGCSATGGAPLDALAALAGPLALGLLSVVRRRRR